MIPTNASTMTWQMDGNHVCTQSHEDELTSDDDAMIGIGAALIAGFIVICGAYVYYDKRVKLYQAAASTNLDTSVGCTSLPLLVCVCQFVQVCAWTCSPVQIHFVRACACMVYFSVSVACFKDAVFGISVSHCVVMCCAKRWMKNSRCS